MKRQNPLFFARLVMPIIALLSVSCSSMMMMSTTHNGQTVESKANTIIIPYDGSREDAFKVFSSHLLSYKHSVQAAVPEIYTLTTTEKKLHDSGIFAGPYVELSLNVIEQEEGSAIVLFGRMRLHSTGWMDIENNGSNVSSMWTAWSEMYKIASAFSKNLKFERR
jgi:hypothetical protein